MFSGNDGSIYYSGFGYSSNLICQFEPSTSWTLLRSGAQVDSLDLMISTLIILIVTMIQYILAICLSME